MAHDDQQTFEANQSPAMRQGAPSRRHGIPTHRARCPDRPLAIGRAQMTIEGVVAGAVAEGGPRTGSRHLPDVLSEELGALRPGAEVATSSLPELYGSIH